MIFKENYMFIILVFFMIKKKIIVNIKLEYELYLYIFLM